MDGDEDQDDEEEEDQTEVHLSSLFVIFANNQFQHDKT